MAANDEHVVLIPIADIDQEGRWRKTPTRNLDKLAASIDEIGLLHPIVVLPINGEEKYPLVVGQRRVLACEQLGFDEIEARIAHDMDEAARLLAEHDENICREKMTPSEALACMNARKELLAPEAQERKQGSLKRGKSRPTGKISQTENSTREAAAEGSGYSGKTLEKVQKIEQHAANPELPEEIRAFIQGKLDELNAAEKPKIDPVFREVEKVVKFAEAQAAKESEEEAASEEEPYHGQKKAIDSARKALAKSFTALRDSFEGAENFDPDVTPEEVDEFVKSLRKLLNEFAKAVKDVGA
jgi:ParB/RepB/Spo0J family partition protein